MDSEPKVEVYLDGSCPFCQWVRVHIEPWDSNSHLRFVDYNNPQIAASTPFSMEELAREMHLRMPDGTWSSGFEAWVRILRVLPALSWLGWLLGLPPLRWLGPPTYRWIARHRLHLPGIPPPCTSTTCPPPREISR
jgi:predicted DCC family thiol-disulfide oxidoreductase YuxK